MADSSRLVPMAGLKLVREDYRTNLQYYRNLKRITQADLAERAGVNLRTLQDYEQGRKPINNAGAATVLRISTVLGVDVKDLLEPENNTSK